MIFIGSKVWNCSLSEKRHVGVHVPCPEKHRSFVNFFLAMNEYLNIPIGLPVPEFDLVDEPPSFSGHISVEQDFSCLRKFSNRVMPRSSGCKMSCLSSVQHRLEK